jgi:hypothetical protein
VIDRRVCRSKQPIVLHRLPVSECASGAVQSWNLLIYSARFAQGQNDPCFILRSAASTAVMPVPGEPQKKL